MRVKIAPCQNDRPASLRYVRLRPNKCSHASADFVWSFVRAIWKFVDPDNYVDKLPNEIRLEVARNSKEEVWKIEDLLLMIEKEVEARETSEQISKNKWKRPQVFFWKIANTHCKRIVC